MKVILQQDVAHLGRIGEVVKVKDGYARNFLVPRGLAVIADERNVSQVKHFTRVAEARAARQHQEALVLAERVNGTPVTIHREAGEENQLFGSVSNRDIAAALEEEGIVVDRRHIVMDEPIRKLGKFQVDVKITSDVQATVTVYVIQR